MKRIIVTAANEEYAPLLMGLISSIHKCSDIYSDDIGVLDLGLADQTLRRLSQKVTHVVCPGWDLPVEQGVRDSKPHLRASFARPFLPKYFPGYDLYLWLDADTWLQEKYPLEWFFDAAANGAIGVAPELDRSYVLNPSTVQWRKNRLAAYFGEQAKALLETNYYYNSGAFSLRLDAPHWRAWGKYFEIGLKSSSGIFSDQTALNYAIWRENLPVHPLPASCNWLCHLALPGVDLKSRKFVEPHIPGRPLGLIHMTADFKDFRYQIKHKGVLTEIRLRSDGFDFLAEEN
jgi:lipopolysaccharide biosynthesis glycosyltransferase